MDTKSMVIGTLRQDAWDTAVEIHERIVEYYEKDISASSIYAALRHFKGKGYVRSRERESTKAELRQHGNRKILEFSLDL